MDYWNPYYAIGSFFSAIFGGLHWILLAVLLVLGIYAIILLIQVMRKAGKALDIWLERNRPGSRPGPRPGRHHGPWEGYPYQRWDDPPQGQAYQGPEGPNPGGEWNGMPQGQAYHPGPQAPDETESPVQ